MTKTVVITDLDGTLLDASDYSFAEALPAVALLKEKGVPLVMCSSKTRSEIELYRKRLSNSDPFISENGGGVFIPRGYFPFDVGGEAAGGYNVITLGRPYRELRKVFEGLRSSLGVNVRGFGDMTAKEAARITGMTVEEAELARQREFDEPFEFVEACEEEKKRFLAAVEAKGLNWTRGRFYHIIGDNDKGRAAEILKGFFKKQYSGKIFTIGLGDKMNDLPLLRAVDMPVLIPGPGGVYETGMDVKNLVKAGSPGPKGWCEVIMDFFKKEKSIQR